MRTPASALLVAAALAFCGGSTASRGATTADPHPLAVSTLLGARQTESAPQLAAGLAETVPGALDPHWHINHLKSNSWLSDSDQAAGMLPTGLPIWPGAPDYARARPTPPAAFAPAPSVLLLVGLAGAAVAGACAVGGPARGGSDDVFTLPDENEGENDSNSSSSAGTDGEGQQKAHGKEHRKKGNGIGGGDDDDDDDDGGDSTYDPAARHGSALTVTALTVTAPPTLTGTASLASYPPFFTANATPTTTATAPATPTGVASFGAAVETDIAAQTPASYGLTSEQPGQQRRNCVPMPSEAQARAQGNRHVQRQVPVQQQQQPRAPASLLLTVVTAAEMESEREPVSAPGPLGPGPLAPPSGLSGIRSGYLGLN